MTYEIWRHKNNPNNRYWVEMAGDSRRPMDYHVMPQGPQVEYKERLVRLKGVKNVRFDEEDLDFSQAPEAGMWPYERFLELYEREEG